MEQKLQNFNQIPQLENQIMKLKQENDILIKNSQNTKKHLEHSKNQVKQLEVCCLLDLFYVFYN